MNLERVHGFLTELTAERDRYDAAIVKLRDMIAGIEGVPAVRDAPVGADKARGGNGKRDRPAPAPKTNKAPAKPPLKVGSAKTGTRVIDRTIAALTKRGRPMSVVEIAREIGHNPGSLQQCLAAYVKRGMIVHTGRAEFGLPDLAPVEPPVPGDGDLSGGAPARFSAYHLPEPYRGGYRCSRCREYHPTPEGFTEFCPAGVA